jgi:rhamnose utilization protein RhaD (predicted bifunctional aldolase and dehydrogenase)
MPHVRGLVSRKQRWIGSFSDLPQVLDFVNSAHAVDLAHLGTSCPDHFIRTKIRPMFIKWNPAGDPASCRSCWRSALETYRAEYAEYYKKHALKDSPAVRDASPTVVLIPGVGMFSFGKNKAESRITGEFYINAIGVMQGAGALGANGTAARFRRLVRLPGRASSRLTRTMLRCRRARRSGLSTGSWKRRRSAASRRRRS